MLKAGLNIEGFDASEHMLAALREKYAYIRQTQYKQPTTKTCSGMATILFKTLSAQSATILFLFPMDHGDLSQKKAI